MIIKLLLFGLASLCQNGEMYLFSDAKKVYTVAWPSGLRRWFKAPVSSEAWPCVSFYIVNDSPILSSQIEFFLFFFYILVFNIFDFS